MTIAFLAAATVMLVAATAFVLAPQFRASERLRRPILLFALALPVFVVGSYAAIGTPRALAVAPPHPVPAKSAADAQQPVASVGKLVEGLRNRLEKSPDDAEGWRLLARSYEHLGRDADAQLARARARALERGTATGTTALRGRVSLDPALAAEVDPADTVFVFAKESRSHRMPVAALRRSVGDLPLEFALTNEHTMIAGTDLAGFDSLVLTARVSPTGRATDAEGMFEAWSAAISPADDATVELVIAQRNSTAGATQ